MVPLASFILGVPFAVGAVLDLAANIRTFARPISLASLRPLHRVHAVEPVVAALSEAGIEARLRSFHVRALLHFFGPYAPVEVLSRLTGPGRRRPSWSGSSTADGVVSRWRLGVSPGARQGAGRIDSPVITVDSARPAAGLALAQMTS